MPSRAVTNVRDTQGRSYLERGLRVVCEEFKGVILNGSMIRDWSCIDRPNLTEL